MPGSTIKLDEGKTLDPETNVMLEQVYGVVKALPEAQRMVMLLVCVEGFSYREKSETLSVPIKTIMSRLARARVSIGLYALSDNEKLMSLRNTKGKS